MNIIQVSIQLGHKANERTKPTKEGYTHDWVVFVRGASNNSIEHFVDKVVFHLHETFPKPKRVVKCPPYEVRESGYAGFLLNIEVHFKNKEEPKKVRFDYDLFFNLPGTTQPASYVQLRTLKFTNPPDEFLDRLFKGGAQEVDASGRPIMRNGNSSQKADVAASPPDEQLASKSKGAEVNSSDPMRVNGATKKSEKSGSSVHKFEKALDFAPPAVKGGVAVPSRSSPAAPSKPSPAAPTKTSPPGSSKTSPPAPSKTSPAAFSKPSPPAPSKTSPAAPSKKSPPAHPKTNSTAPSKKSPHAPSKLSPAAPIKRSPGAPSKTSPPNAPSKTSPTAPPKTSPAAPPKTSPAAPPKTSPAAPLKTCPAALPPKNSPPAPKESRKRPSSLSSPRGQAPKKIKKDHEGESKPKRNSESDPRSNSGTLGPPSSRPSQHERPMANGKSKSSSSKVKSEKVSPPSSTESKTPKGHQPKPAESSRSQTRPNGGSEKTSASAQWDNGHLRNLLQLREKLDAVKEAKLLQRVVSVLEETGKYSRQCPSLEIDLCALDSKTVKRLEECFT